MVRIRRQMKIWNEEERFLWRKGSITVESAFILPLFFFAITMIAGMLDLYHTTVLVQTPCVKGQRNWVCMPIVFPGTGNLRWVWWMTEFVWLMEPEKSEKC